MAMLGGSHSREPVGLLGAQCPLGEGTWAGAPRLGSFLRGASRPVTEGETRVRPAALAPYNTREPDPDSCQPGPAVPCARG